MSRVAFLGVIAALVALVAGVTVYTKYDDWFILPKARHLVADKLRDPAATQFRNDRIATNGWHCGEVNAKNGMGGYSGFKRFASDGANGVIYLEGDGMLGEQSTQEIIAVLDKQIAYNKVLAALVKENPDLQLPSEASRTARARTEVFEDHWKAICNN